jgi:uncharacterized protein (TIGR03435 family)
MPKSDRFLAVFGSVLLALPALGQGASTTLSFDVATVRPSAPPDMARLQAQAQAGKMPRFGAYVEVSRAEYLYMSLQDLIANAYKVKSYQVTGPAWLATQRFDIAAKLPDGASKDDAPMMLQALLKERFKLVAHRDLQEHPVLGLVVAKGGTKLKESATVPVAIDEDAPLKPGEMKIDTPDGPARMTRNADGSNTINMGAKGVMTQTMDMQSQTLRLESSAMTMEGFADMLTTVMRFGGGAGGRQVVDMTDLKGTYQVAVEFSLAELMANARAQGMNTPGPPGGGGGGQAGTAAMPSAADPSGGATVFESVQKLGLKLEPRKAKVEQMVVDSVEKAPTEN